MRAGEPLGGRYSRRGPLRSSDRLTRTAKVALDVGLEEQRITLQTAVVALMVKAIEGVLVDSGVDPEDPTVRASVAQHVLALADPAEVSADDTAA